MLIMRLGEVSACQGKFASCIENFRFPEYVPAVSVRVKGGGKAGCGGRIIPGQALRDAEVMQCPGFAPSTA
jgi:hypothetical protein